MLLNRRIHSPVFDEPFTSTAPAGLRTRNE